MDCTAAGKELCNKFDVHGYPTLLYGGPPTEFPDAPVEELRKYEEGRQFQDLTNFVSERLGPVCDPDNLHMCNDRERKFVEKHMNVSYEKVAHKYKKLEQEVEAIDDRWMAFLDSTQEKGNAARINFEEAMAHSGLELMIAVKHYREMVKKGKILPKSGKTEL